MSNNVYYEPGASGLEIFGSLDEDGLSYEYNTLLVFKHSSGNLYWATDSGCSCPTPFDEYHFTSPEDTDLTPLNEQSLSSFIGDVTNFPAPQDERESLIDLVQKELRSRK